MKRFIFWDYARGSWQYDLVVLIILAFIFLTPRTWFRDRPRTPIGSQIASLPSHSGSVFWLEPELVGSIPEGQRLEKLSGVLTAQKGRKQAITRLEPIYDSEQELKGYMAFAKP